MSQDDIKVRTRSFLQKHVRAEISDSIDLFESGLVNSLFALQLVVFVEQAFGVRVENEDLELRNFNAIESIADFVQRKRALASGQGEASHALAAD